MSTAHQYCTFTLGEFTFGVEVRTVQEVLRYQQMTPVPLAPAVVRGLINLRGQIVTAIDLRRRLDLPAAPAEAQPMNIIVNTADNAVSLLVDEIGDVVDVEAELYEPPPETLTGAARKLVRGVYKLSDRLLLILNIAQVITLQPGNSPAHA